MKHPKCLIKSAALALLLAIGTNNVVMAAGDDDKTTEQLVAVALVSAMVVAIVALTHQPDPLRHSAENLKEHKEKPSYDLGLYFAVSPEKTPAGRSSMETNDYQIHSGIKVKF